MSRFSMTLLAVTLTSGALYAAPSTVTHRVLQKRSVFDLVGGKTDLRAVCAGEAPLSVELKRTAGDIAAAIFSGLWYTPVHLQVICAAPVAMVP